MKSLFYLKVLAFILFINSSIMAQEDGFLLDSTRMTITFGYGTYTQTKDYYYYNNFNQLKFVDKYTNKNSIPDPPDWYCTGKEYHYYDDEHRIIKDIIQSRYTFETDWSDKFRWEYDYNDSAFSKTNSYWDFDTNVWLYAEKIIDSIKPPEALEGSHLTLWDYEEGIGWKDYQWRDTAFLSNMMIDSVFRKSWLITNPDDVSLVIRKYDYSQPDTTFVHESSPWGLGLDKIYYSEDSLTGGDTILKRDDLYGINEDGDTTPIKRYKYYYDGENRLIRYVHYMKFSDWFIQDLIKYIYDEEGFLIEMIDCCNNQKTYYYYNDDGLLWKKIFHKNSFIYTYYYYYTYTYVGISNNLPASSESILFYPNPAQREVWFNLSENTIKEFQIYDVTGSMIKQGKLFNGQQSLDVSSLISGYYVVVINSAGKSYQGKFIKY